MSAVSKKVTTQDWTNIGNMWQPRNSIAHHDSSYSYPVLSCAQWRIQNFRIGGAGVPLPSGDGVWGGGYAPSAEFFF